MGDLSPPRRERLAELRRKHRPEAPPPEPPRPFAELRGETTFVTLSTSWQPVGNLWADLSSAKAQSAFVHWSQFGSVGRVNDRLVVRDTTGAVVAETLRGDVWSVDCDEYFFTDPDGPEPDGIRIFARDAHRAPVEWSTGGTEVRLTRVPL